MSDVTQSAPAQAAPVESASPAPGQSTFDPSKSLAANDAALLKQLEADLALSAAPATAQQPAAGAPQRDEKGRFVKTAEQIAAEAAVPAAAAPVAGVEFLPDGKIRYEGKEYAGAEVKQMLDWVRSRAQVDQSLIQRKAAIDAQQAELQKLMAQFRAQPTAPAAQTPAPAQAASPTDISPENVDWSDPRKVAEFIRSQAEGIAAKKIEAFEQGWTDRQRQQHQQTLIQRTLDTAMDAIQSAVEGHETLREDADTVIPALMHRVSQEMKLDQIHVSHSPEKVRAHVAQLAAQLAQGREDRMRARLNAEMDKLSKSREAAPPSPPLVSGNVMPGAKVTDSFSIEALMDGQNLARQAQEDLRRLREAGQLGR